MCSNMFEAPDIPEPPTPAPPLPVAKENDQKAPKINTGSAGKNSRNKGRSALRIALEASPGGMPSKSGVNVPRGS